MSERRAILRVSPQLLCNQFQFPPGSEITGARMTGSGEIEFILDSPALPDVPALDSLPLVKAIYHTVHEVGASPRAVFGRFETVGALSMPRFADR